VARAPVTAARRNKAPDKNTRQRKSQDVKHQENLSSPDYTSFKKAEKDLRAKFRELFPERQFSLQGLSPFNEPAEMSDLKEDSYSDYVESKISQDLNPALRSLLVNFYVKRFRWFREKIKMGFLGSKPSITSPRETKTETDQIGSVVPTENSEGKTAAKNPKGISPISVGGLAIRPLTKTREGTTQKPSITRSVPLETSE
jgi:hypothetical protein